MRGIVDGVVDDRRAGGDDFNVDFGAVVLDRVKYSIIALCPSFSYVIPKKTGAGSTVTPLDFEDCSVAAINYIGGSRLDPRDADRPFCREFFGAVASLFKNQTLVDDLHVGPVVFGVQPHGQIVGRLRVVVNQPVSVEGVGLRVR